MELVLPKFEDLAFIDEKHEYSVNGFIVPSTTEVMKPLSDRTYRTVDDSVLSKAAARGTKIHEAMENYMLYGIEDIDKEHQGYLDGFKRWVDFRKPQPVATEYRMYHKTLRYAGTLDLLADIGGELALVDYKSTSVLLPMLTRVQTESYKKGVESWGVCIQRKLVVQVKKDGSYKEEMHELHDAEAWRVFCSLLEVSNYIKKHKK